MKWTTVRPVASKESFPGVRVAMVAAAVEAGNSRAEQWVLDLEDDGFCTVLWDKGNNVLYCSGSAEPSHTLSEGLDRLLLDVIRPQCLGTERPYFSTKCLSHKLEDMWEYSVQPWLTGSHRKCFYERSWTQELPEGEMTKRLGFSVLPIDRSLLNDTALANIDAIREEVSGMWPSLEAFCQYGFGVAIAYKGEVLSWCTAEYVSDDRCGVGIETVESYQKQGLATWLTHEFLLEAQRRRINVGWECWAGNVASIRVAEKCGFTLLEEGTMLVGKFT